MVKFRMNSTALIKQLGDKLSLTFAQWLTDNRPSSLWHTCASCHHVQKQGPMFCKKYQMVPPVAIIVGDKSCEGYADEAEIPF
jgi:cytochrome c553